MSVTAAFKSIGLVILLLTLCSATSFGQNAGDPTDSRVIFSVHATHLMGFDGARKHSTGTLSIQDRELRFQKGSEPAAQILISSIQDVFLGEQSKQVGGLPMTLGKAAAPFGGGRVVSLFAHKKYDTLALEYIASDGGTHGAIFELSKGQAKVLRDHLVSLGAHASHNDEIQTKQQGDSR